MFLRHARRNRLAVVYLVFTVTLMIVPKADISATPFDEANTPTNEIVVKKDASSWKLGQSVTTFAPSEYCDFSPRQVGIANEQTIKHCRERRID